MIIHNEELALVLNTAIETDMRRDNSWNAASDNPNRHVPLGKRTKLRVLQTMPTKPLL